MAVAEDIAAELGCSGDAFVQHAPAATVADLGALRVQDLLKKRGCAHADRVAKNLLLKDKRSRYFLCTALHDTEIPFEKALPLRLGLKKGELRLAPPEAMRDVLGVGAGAATPLATARESAARCVLLMDERLREGPFWVHPCVNDASVLVTAEQVSAYLKTHGREAHFTDLAVTQFATGPGCVPDLKAAADSVAPVKAAAGEAVGVAAGTDSKKAKKAARAAEKSGSQGAGKVVAAEQVDSVSGCVAKLLHLVQGEVGEASKLSEAQERALSSEFELEVNALRNAAFARGMACSRASIAAQVLGEWD